MKLALIIMAAGLGSRYGGSKQIDIVGPNKETILDYSVYDAIKAGFEKIIFIVNSRIQEIIEQKMLNVYPKYIEYELVFQNLEELSRNYTCPPGRKKPWGTAHAVLSAKNKIKEPFAVINADDFYGKLSFNLIANHLKRYESRQYEFVMIGFELLKTLTKEGTVSRGICLQQEGYLESIQEREKVLKKNGAAFFQDKKNQLISFPENTLVSMNFWGFPADVFASLEFDFSQFLKEHGQELKKEYYLPFFVNQAMKKMDIAVKVLKTSDQWLGVTYAGDKIQVVTQIGNMIAKGMYPSPLF